MRFLAGWGVRRHPALLRKLVRLTGAPVFCTPRAKGVFPERDPLFAGVTGLGGNADLAMLSGRDAPIKRLLVLGSRLGEPSSGFHGSLVPRNGAIQVDNAQGVHGVAFPGTKTIAVHAETGAFLRAVLTHRDKLVKHTLPAFPRATGESMALPVTTGTVHPRELMAAIQRVLVDGSNVAIIAEPSSAMIWGTHLLRFDRPGRWRVSNSFGAMGAAAAGVLDG
jgi:thiamine pyrophosphate-dependent acetolactate synthase large subunit-like protein